ncbi:MAG: helix-turn-helix domain-containing protein [Oscillospiraceae bacterium]|nr:helix-turn-helix domain-containing protein [Oscillospiraceae bacterium]
MSTFSERLKLLRKNKNLTQNEMAKIINSTERGYRNYEINKFTPTLDILIALANYFNVSLDYLAGLVDIKEEAIIPTGTFITVLGSSGCRYDYGNDTASYLINNKVIVDTGWNLVENILDLGLNPADFKTVLFTHFHHDHYIALPQFLFYHLNEGRSLNELTFVGPGELHMVVALAMNFLQVSRFYENAGYPKCTEIRSGENITINIDSGTKLFIEAHKSIHPVDGRYYCVTDMVTNSKIGFAGDTAYNHDEIAFFKNCDLLIHECSLGGKHTGDNLYLHSDAEEAASVAADAGVKKLALVHYPARIRTECFDSAVNKFKGEVLTPIKGDVILC